MATFSAVGNAGPSDKRTFPGRHTTAFSPLARGSGIVTHHGPAEQNRLSGSGKEW